MEKKSNLAFVGCMFIGVGIGIVTNHTAEGTLIGMGIGFIAMFFSKGN